MPSFPNQASEFVYVRSYSRWLDEEQRRETWDETVDRYIAFIEKHVGDTVPQKVFKKAKQKILDFEVMPSMRAMWAAGPAAEATNVALFNCLSRDTAFITDSGVQSFSDFEDGDETVVLTHTGSWKKAVVRNHGHQELYNINFRVSHASRGQHTVRATRDHRWLLANGVVTTNLMEGDLVMHAPRTWVWDFGDADPLEKLYWCYGYVYGDGTLVHSGKNTYSMVRLCGKDAGFAKRFEDCGFRTSNCASIGADFMAYTGSYLKTLPDLERDPVNLIRSFVAGFMDADGTKDTNKPGSWGAIQQTGEESIEFLKKALPLCGLYITRSDDFTHQKTNFGKRSGRTERIVVKEHNAPWRVTSIQKSTKSDVWCLEVEDDNSFVLPNGIVTGNCAFQAIDHVDAFAECLYILMCGTGYGFSVERKYVDKLPVVSKLNGKGAGTFEIPDSKEGWADSVKHLMQALYAGRDLELDYSLLRPRGSRLKTFGGRSSGPAPLISLHNFIRQVFEKAQGRHLKPIECLDVLNKIAEIVVVGGVRRSSQICLSDLDDEDIEHAKRWPFPLHRAMSNNSATYHEKPGAVKFLEEWASLAKSGTGERGIFNLQGAKKRCPERRDASKIAGVNPCQPGWATLMTPEGIRRMDDIVEGSVVWSGDRWRRVTAKAFTGVKPVHCYSTTAGRFFGTENHRVFQNGGRVEVYEAESIDVCRGPGAESLRLSPDDVMDGLVLGDGMVHAASNNLICLCIGADDSDYFESEIADLISIRRPGISDTAYEIKTGLPFHHVCKTYERVVPDEFFFGSLTKMAGFLRGLFSANGGTNAGGSRVELRQTSHEMIRQVQEMLSCLGIRSYITTDKPKKVLFENGEYECRQSYKLNITVDRLKFMNLIGFIQKYKRVNDRIGPSRKYSYDVVSVEYVGDFPVYDISVEGDASYWTGCCLVSNCAEILLRSHEFCNLSEVVIRAGDDLDDVLEKVETAVWLGAIQSTFTHFPYLSRRWKNNCEQERLLGVSITGQMDNPSMFTVDAMKAMKAKAIKVAKKACKVLDINFSAAVTCVKPSGCRTWEGLVTTDKGIFTLEELLEAHDSDSAWHDISDHGIIAAGGGPVSKTYINGYAPVKELTLSFGMSLKSTGNHKWYVKGRGWTRTDDLQIDDQLEVKPAVYVSSAECALLSLNPNAINSRKDMMAVKQPKMMTPELAWLLGYLWGDGAMSPARYRLRWIDQRVENLKKTQSILQSVFGVESTLHKASEHRKAHVLEVGSKHLWHWLIKNGVWKYYADKLDVIPKCVRSSSTESIIAFLGGLIDADGWVGDDTLIYTTADEDFSKHVQHVAWSVGVCLGRSHNVGGDNFQPRKSVYLLSLLGNSTKPALETLVQHCGKAHPNLRAFSPKRVFKSGVVKKIEDAGEAPTFDVETAEHWFYAGVVKSHNTVSQLVNSSSGLHPRYARYYIRRYRISSMDPLFRLLKDQGVPMSPENGQRESDWKKAQGGDLNACPIYEKSKRWSEDRVNTWVVSFPVESPKRSIHRKQLTAIDQLNYYKKVQENWCEHNASCTIQVGEHEWFEVGNWVYQNWKHVTGVSFLNEDGGNYEQTPYEEVDEQEYKRLKDSFPRIDYSKLSEYEREDQTTGSKELACAGDSCDI